MFPIFITFHCFLYTENLASNHTPEYTPDIKDVMGVIIVLN